MLVRRYVFTAMESSTKPAADPADPESTVAVHQATNIRIPSPIPASTDAP